MNQLKSEKENGHELPYVFISIFYAREKWHDLLPIIHQSLMDQRRLHVRPEHSYVFFSTHRGSSIRIALKYEKPDQKQAYSEILDPIVSYMERHPSFSQRLQLPITSFFLDFPSNSIQFNLYSESSIATGGLSQFQVMLSQIMLQFFDDHPIDQEGIFTLIIWLQEAILNGLSNTDRPKHELIAEIISQMHERKSSSELKPYQLEETDLFEELQPFMVNSNLENLFLQIDLFTVLLNDRLKNPIQVYFILLRLIREHLPKLSNEIVLESLQHLNSPVSIDGSV